LYDQPLYCGLSYLHYAVQPSDLLPVDLHSRWRFEPHLLWSKVERW